MEIPKPIKEIVTVAEMSQMCGLSRSRFYSLIQDGIMPQPSRKPETNRPFYSRDQQEQCLLVRRTNCGVNGKPILFYVTRFDKVPTRPKPLKITSKKEGQSDPVVDELLHGLEQLGIPDVPEKQIRAALAETYPDGNSGVPTATLLMSVFRYLKCHNPEDNHS